MLIERKDINDEDGKLGYVECVFKSDNILKTTYFPAQQRLYIAFSRGQTYSYSNITEKLFSEFIDASSHGKFFYKNLNNKNKYPFRKEFTLYPSEILGLKEVVENFKPEDDE